MVIHRAKGAISREHGEESYCLYYYYFFFIRFIGDSSFQNSVYVRVESTAGSHSMKFVKHTTGQEKKETLLCDVSIIPVPKRQVFSLLPLGLDNFPSPGSDGCFEVSLSSIILVLL